MQVRDAPAEPGEQLNHCKNFHFDGCQMFLSIKQQSEKSRQEEESRYLIKS